MNASAARQIISYDVSAAQIAEFRAEAEANLRTCTGHVATAVAEGFAQSESYDALKARAMRKGVRPASPEFVAMVKRNERATAAAIAVRELMNRRERALPLTRTEQAIADHIADLYADYVAGCIQHQIDRAEGNA